ncbi:outer membrane beta-barrel protein [Polynucleobacter paneuropaeus]|nr:outer membrane beta-barrel protein [Polynucleobacter paneuropaeus]QWD39923.1 outer membrane beta-barrel protein [Polynucleobacter paneuropaeus]
MPWLWFNSLFLLISVVWLPTTAQGQDQARSRFEGFYTDLGLGYRDINTSNSTVLTLNGSVIPSSVSSSGSSHTLAVLTTGYNFHITQNYFLAIGANISPANGLTQQLQIQALNKTTTVSGIRSLYNYGFFLSPGFKTEDGLIYLKAGKQTQVNNSNSGPNFNGYLFGLGYKQFIYESIYLFGEANYSFYESQTMSRTIISSGRTINASVISSPQTTRILLGLGYQF